MSISLTDAQRDELKNLVARVEKTAGVEIVPFIVSSSDSYEVVHWRAAAIGALAFLLFAFACFFLYDGWALGWLYTGFGLAIGVVVAAASLALAPLFSKPLFRILAGKTLLRRRTRARAERSFHAESVSATEGRTGILVFISLMERRIEIIPDLAIARAVQSSDWDVVIGQIRETVRSKGPHEGMKAGIAACGQVIEESGFVGSGQSGNELRDDVRFGD